ncbi:unnamed protein product [Psylliodes chrysocephalus]|uniref:Uncharacterized protein n=1 Tax=Psylliodes chrysocephalus TaxID=3402493 RepID=A0A9P0DA56_9CUCU|nr:unnamed protein product [Psylliodes chrysocephala]
MNDEKNELKIAFCKGTRGGSTNSDVESEIDPFHTSSSADSDFEPLDFEIEENKMKTISDGAEGSSLDKYKLSRDQEQQEVEKHDRTRANKEKKQAENFEGMEINIDKSKFGVDGGGGFLKVCCSVLTRNLNEEEVVPEKRQRYTDDVLANDLKDSDVKRLFILVIGKCTQENYDNVAALWNLLQINNFDGTIATDLKLANILSGLMAHSASHPCTWCDVHKTNLKDCGSYRTIGNCLANYENWTANDAIFKNAKDYKNCIKPSILSTDDDKRIINIIPPPELHLMLGVVNTIVGVMAKECEVDTNK